MLAQEAAFAIGVPPHLYAFHCYTWNSTSLCRTRKPASHKRNSQVKPGDFTPVLTSRLRTLYAQ